MTYPRLPAAARPLAAACFRQVRQRLAYVRQAVGARTAPGDMLQSTHNDGARDPESLTPSHDHTLIRRG